MRRAAREARRAENLLVLSGEKPPRTWSEPVPLRDVLRAAIAETENLERVVFIVDEQSAVVGHAVTDLTHLLAELTENAVRFSPPDTTVRIRSRPDRGRPGGRVITIEDWGLGMLAEQIEEYNALLAAPLDVDLSISQRLGFHVVSRLAARHGIKVSLNVKPESGTTALIVLPPSMFAPLLPSAAALNGGPVVHQLDERPTAPPIVPVDHVPAPAAPYPPLPRPTASNQPSSSNRPRPSDQPITSSRAVPLFGRRRSRGPPFSREVRFLLSGPLPVRPPEG